MRGIARRTFVASVASASMFVRSVFGSEKRPKLTTLADVTPPPQGVPHKSVVYIYNAGMDFEGIQGHTFGKYSSLPGGKVTRIEQCEEWSGRGVDQWETGGRVLYSRPGRFAKFMGVKPRATGFEPSEGDRMRAAGLYRQESVRTRRTTFLYASGKEYHKDQFEPRYIIVHPAKEIACNLASWDRDSQLYVLDFWNGKEVDVDWVNKLIASDTIEGRIQKASALRGEREIGLLELRRRVLLFLGLHTQMLRKRLARNIATTGVVSSYEQKAMALLGMDLSDVMRLKYQARYRDPMYHADPRARSTHERLDALSAWIEREFPT